MNRTRPAAGRPRGGQPSIAELRETHLVYPFTLVRVVRNSLVWGVAMALLLGLVMVVKNHDMDWFKINWLIATIGGPGGPIFNLGMYVFRGVYAKKLLD